ncbi:hypothetical protein JTB14_007983 [Gonioctena quinquepunctata]|nr:hypothetical protein JTB14_007983 [Gonioctena quinquepunctata]
MEQTKKHRSVLRSAFTKKANELDQLITAEVKDMQQIQVAWEILQQKYDALVVSESEVYGALLAQDASEEDLELEMESSDVYRVRFTTMKLRFKKGAHDEEVRSVLQSEQLSTRYQIEDLLRVWQRSTEFSSGRRSDDVDSIVPEDSTLDSRLKGLMRFLKNEIENEQRISLASEGFGLCSNNVSTNDRHKKDNSKPTATLSTAAGLINCDVAKCVFCGGIHDSEGCFKAQKLSFVQKKNTLSDKKACFRCLKIGHISRRCRSRLKCVICGKSHVTLMCADLPSNKITPADKFSGSREKRAQN